MEHENSFCLVNYILHESPWPNTKTHHLSMPLTRSWPLSLPQPWWTPLLPSSPPAAPPCQLGWLLDYLLAQWPSLLLPMPLSQSSQLPMTPPRHIPPSPELVRLL